MIVNPLSLVFTEDEYSPTSVIQGVFHRVDGDAVEIERSWPVQEIEPEALTINSREELGHEAERIAKVIARKPTHFKLLAAAGLGKSIYFPSKLSRSLRGQVVVIQPNDILLMTTYNGSIAQTVGPKAAVFSDDVAIGQAGGVVYISATRFLRGMLETPGLRASVRAVICDESHHDDGIYSAVKSVLARMNDVSVIYLTATGKALSALSELDKRIVRHNVDLVSASDILDHFHEGSEERYVITNSRMGFKRSMVFLPDVSQHVIMMKHYEAQGIPCVSLHRGMSASAVRDAIAVLDGKAYAVVTDDSSSSGLNLDIEVVIDTVVKRQIAYDVRHGQMSIESVPVRSFENDQRRWRLARFRNLEANYYGPAQADSAPVPDSLLVDDTVIHQMYLRAFDIYETKRPWSDYINDLSIDLMQKCALTGFIGLLPLYIMVNFGLSLSVRDLLTALGIEAPKPGNEKFLGKNVAEFRRKSKHDRMTFPWLAKFAAEAPSAGCDDDSLEVAESISKTTSTSSKRSVSQKSSTGPLSVAQSGTTAVSKASVKTDMLALVKTGKVTDIIQDVMASDTFDDQLDKFVKHGFVPTQVLGPATLAQGAFKYGNQVFGCAGAEFFPVESDNTLASNSFAADVHNAMTKLHREYNPFDSSHVPNLAHTEARGKLRHIEYGTNFSDVDLKLINEISNKGLAHVQVSEDACDRMIDPLDELFGAIMRARNYSMKVAYQVVVRGVTDVSRRTLKSALSDVLLCRRMYDQYLAGNQRYAVLYVSAFHKHPIERNVLR